MYFYLNPPVTSIHGWIHFIQIHLGPKKRTYIYRTLYYLKTISVLQKKPILKVIKLRVLIFVSDNMHEKEKALLGPFLCSKVFLVFSDFS